MLNTGTKKVIRDLLQEKRRTLTVLLAMVIGVFAVAMMSTSKSLLDKNLTENFLRTNPASFSVFVNNIDSAEIAQLQNMPEIDELTTRKSIWIRMKKPDGNFLPVLLYVVNNVQKPLISTYTIDEGDYPASKNEIVIERTGKKLDHLYTGQTLELNFPGYTAENYTISGFTHDAGIAPSWMEGYLYGYISASALPAGYLAQFPTEIKCTVANNKFNRAHIEGIAKTTQTQLTQMSVQVINSEVHEPGVHMHQKQMNALMFLNFNFGILALILSCFLIINMISAIMAKEKKQIAIMKATGASTIQITRIYITTIFIMSIASMLVGTPLGIIAGRSFASFNASMLNFELFDRAIEPLVLLLIVIMGTILPLIISVFPILNSSRLSVLQGLNETGVENAGSKSLLLRGLSKLFSGSFILALRNAFRRKTRLAITVISLSIGGAIFMTAFNIRQSTNNAIDNVFDNQPQDIIYWLSVSNPALKIDSLLLDKDVKYELGYRAQGNFALENGLTSNTFTITSIEATSNLMAPVIHEGRWIVEGENELVINQILQKENGSIPIGGEVILSINGKPETYTIVGVCQEMFTPAGLFMGKSQFEQHLSILNNSGNFLMIDTKSDLQKDIAQINIGIENTLKANNISVVNSVTKAAYKTAVVEHLLIIMVMLLSMTLLVVIVGGLGMATSININVSERKRELGILRAIGILKSDIRTMVTTEAITMGGLSWILALLLAIPLSSFLGNEFFTIFFESRMDISISPIGIFLWLLLTVIIATISSIVPANRVINGKLTNALNYE